jgi:predicted glutamine amidotransferase
MCRILGCVSSEPVSIRHELVEAANPMIRQSEEHDSGWGLAVYETPNGAKPRCLRFPQAAYADSHFAAGATELTGRIFNVHVRRATMGGLELENTHPFCHDNYCFGHNGTIINFASLLEADVKRPMGQTDSEHLFNHLLARLGGDDVIASLRNAIATTIERSTISGVNFLFSDGRLLYAYKLGIFDLYWLHRPGQIVVASERLTSEDWQPVDQDVLLVCDPQDPSRPHMQRLLGDAHAKRADVMKFEQGSELRGRERGEFAAQRAANLQAAASQ